MSEAIRDEYFWLTDKLDEINWALEGQCDDIDCDQYMYKDIMKKKYKPVLEHNFSCIENLKRNKAAVLRMLSLKRFRKFRYEGCGVCGEELDKLSDSSEIFSFKRPCPNKKECFEWEGDWIH